MYDQYYDLVFIPRKFSHYLVNGGPKNSASTFVDLGFHTWFHSDTF